MPTTTGIGAARSARFLQAPYQVRFGVDLQFTPVGYAAPSGTAAVSTGTVSPLTWNVVNYDRNHFYDFAPDSPGSGYRTNVMVPKDGAGLYVVTFSARWDNASAVAGSAMGINVVRDGADTTIARTFPTGSASGTDIENTLTTFAELQDYDMLYTWVFHGSGANRNLIILLDPTSSAMATPRFSLYRVAYLD